MKKILVVVAVLAVILALRVSRQPDRFTITRSAVLSAPAPVLFGLVNDFHQWERWSPWAKLDPHAKNTFGGAASGVGSNFAWEGNKDVGSGRMEITESHPPEHIQLALHF